MKNKNDYTTEFLQDKLENQLQEELDALIKYDQGTKPPEWILSPRAVYIFLMGGEIDGKTITPKYIGDGALIETAIATLATDRALLLTGVPGTAKSRVSEHLAAAISGDTSFLVQGSSATTEEDLLFGWNYASLIAKGPSEEALVPGPVARAMQSGNLVRIEELTRIPSMIQDNLLSLLSEKMMAVPELNLEIRAKKGFNLIATSNDRDRGTYPLSDALKRRFNVVHLPLPQDPETETRIIKMRLEQDVTELGSELDHICPEKEIKRLVQIFRELREGETLDGKQKVKPPQNVLSTAEAISAIRQSIYLATYFGSGQVTAKEIAITLPGSIVKDEDRDGPAWEDYRQNIIRHRKEWADLAEALQLDSTQLQSS